MSWEGKRRATIVGIAALVVLAALLILGFSIFYETPTCTDGTQNQDEQGVDCGGSCSTLCAFQVGSEPVVRFVRAITPQPGRTDVIAYIENRNTDAVAVAAPFLLEVYGTDRQLIAKETIRVDLPPASVVPVYRADVAPRGTLAAQAFLVPDMQSIVWRNVTAEQPTLPAVEQITILETDTPRITAVLSNPFVRAVYDTTLVAVVFDASGNVLAGSQTFVQTLPPQGSVPLVFTWNAPFAAPVARVEILPVPKLPSRAP